MQEHASSNWTGAACGSRRRRTETRKGHLGVGEVCAPHLGRRSQGAIQASAAPPSQERALRHRWPRLAPGQLGAEMRLGVGKAQSQSLMEALPAAWGREGSRSNRSWFWVWMSSRWCVSAVPFSRGWPSSFCSVSRGAAVAGASWPWGVASELSLPLPYWPLSCPCCGACPRVPEGSPS